MRPVIGITVNYSYNGESEVAEGIGAPGQQWQLVADDYIAAVVKAGGIPVMLPIVRSGEVLRDMADRLDGVLFSGGSDVDPMRFGQRTTGKTGPIIRERDDQEFLLADYVINHTNKPVLGICRGIQLINAALGGTLIQHLPDEHLNHTLVMYPRQMISHWVKVEEGSLLHGIVGAGRLGVNSFHHMAVDELAPGLKATAVSDDGVIEAVELSENPSGRFMLAVQWHPEMMSCEDRTQQDIITAFAAACRR